MPYDRDNIFPVREHIKKLHRKIRLKKLQQARWAKEWKEEVEKERQRLKDKEKQ